MDDQEPQTNPEPKKRRPRPWLVVLLSLLFLLLIFFVAIFLGFNYFGERFLRKYLQEKIYTSSNGLYRADFKKMNLNILTGKVVIDSFDLTPDTNKYMQLKTRGKIARALYQISFSSLTIDKIHFRQIYARKRINFRQLTLQRPLISIVGFPDTVAAKRNKWRVVYEDLYPTVSGFFNDFHIDSVKVNHGFLLTSSREKNGRQTSGEYEFSAVLRDVSVNPFSYYNKERVFYSRDIELVVHNFEYHLADSLYSLKAEEIGFSLTKSILSGKKLSLRPNFKSKKIHHLRSGDLFQIDLPSFSISGIDLYKAMTDRKVEVSSLNLSEFFLRIYRSNPAEKASRNAVKKKKITVAGLYTVIAKELRSVAIDTFSLKNGSFEFFANIADKKPELRIGKVDLEMSKFLLDSLSHFDRSRIFYARAIELTLERFSLILRDGIHYIHASSINFSTRKSLIEVKQATIFPNREKNLQQLVNRRNTMFIQLPQLTFTRIDLKKVFNRRILDFDKLMINEPEIRYTRFRPPKNPDSRFKKPKDFFEAENEEVVYNLLKKYLWVVKGNEISITQGFMRYSVQQNDKEMPLATSSFNLAMHQFLIDSVQRMNQQGYFYSRDFNLDLNAVSVISPDSLKYLQADRVMINTKDSLIEADNINIFETASPMRFISPAKKRQILSFEFSLHKLHLTGLNHKKLFLDKILKANQIVFDRPLLSLKTSGKKQSAGSTEETQLLKTTTFMHTFEIGHCIVRKGSFAYNREGDHRASFFSLKDIDFALVNAAVHIPDEGIHDGLIKFDSLQLKVIPLRAVIADSAYALEARSLEVHSYPANITIQGIKVTPLKPWNTMNGPKTQATITIPEIQFKGFYFDRAIFDNEWLLEGLNVDHPTLHLEIKQDEGKYEVKRGKYEDNGIIEFPTFMKTVAVRKVSIMNANATLIQHWLDSTRSYSQKNMMLEVTRFRVDSMTRSNPSSVPLFNADDISFSAPGFSWASKDSMYTYTLGKFGFSTGKASAFIDSASVIPNFSRVDFSKKLGYQADRIVLTVPGIKISQIDFRKLISSQELHARSVTLAGLNFESFRDKRLPFPSWRRPLLPGQMVARIKFPASLDTITLENGMATYEEQSGDEPGRIFFDRMNATLTGFNTLKASGEPIGHGLDLHGSTRLMGITPTEAWFHFQTAPRADSFSVHAAIGQLDLTSINPMLSKLLPVSIQRGTSKSTEIFHIKGDSARASGIMHFRYHNLAIRLDAAGSGTWGRFEQLLLTEVVNIFLANNNPNEDGKMKEGIIYFERDVSKGFFNFLWKSVLSGIKSSVGINTKTQKEIKKQRKHNHR
jgi:hypothetical protein